LAISRHRAIAGRKAESEAPSWQIAHPRSLVTALSETHAIACACAQAFVLSAQLVRIAGVVARRAGSRTPQPQCDLRACARKHRRPPTLARMQADTRRSSGWDARGTAGS
jgi:hypothetical protein